jgi:3-methyladenine DNA glycosylase AlkD
MLTMDENCSAVTVRFPVRVWAKGFIFFLINKTKMIKTKKSYNFKKVIVSELKNYGSPERAKHSLRFFKTGPGQYGEGDLFYGASVPEMRIVAKKYFDIDISDVVELLHDKYHECRLVALLILVDKFEKSKSDSEKKKIFELYLNNSKYINNWDLVDLSAHKIVGAYLFDKDASSRSILYRLAKSKDLWERRISIISTFYFIYKGEFVDTIKISEILVNDKHDLIQKAVGWMLREVGKRGGLNVEEKFLKKHYKTMPRTMLRYAIERFDDKKKKFYMGKS